MRRPWAVLIVLGFFFCSAFRAEAGAIYKIEKGTLEGYREVELTFDSGKVFGEARPLRGYNGPAVRVSGSNPADGIIELTFHFPEPRTLTFKKFIQHGEIRWTAEGAAVTFWRPRTGDFSDADLTLTPHSCGPIYRTLKVSFAEDTKKEELVAFARRNPEIAKLPVTIAVSADENGKLRERRLQLSAALHELWAGSTLYRNVYVPVGTEIAVVRALRQTEFLHADLGEGGCGGADASFFAFDRTVFFNGKTFLKDKFSTFTEQSLKEFASRDRQGRTWDHTIGDGVVSTLKVPPFTSSYRVKMRVASEISRQSPGAWDTFDVALEPADLGMIKRTEYAVVVTVKNLRSVRRSNGRAIRLKDIYSYEPQATAEIESALLVFLSGRIKNGWCYYTAEGIDDPKVMCPHRYPSPNE